MKKVIAVVGPTAAGKTSFSIALAKAVQGEVISADSMQVYKDMPIATAAVTKAQQEGIAHHLTEFLEPNQSFSVAEFVELAKQKTSEICARGNVPIIVGGTGLFFKCLFENIQFSEADQNWALRHQLRQRAEMQGAQALYEELLTHDPITAQAVHPNNIQRVVRALEIFYSTNTTKSSQVAQSHDVPSDLLPLWIGITCQQRQQLYEKINQRVDDMMEQGLLEEAKAVLQRTDAATCKQAIGHKELAAYFEGQLTLQQVVDHLKQETRHYAKRQLTWFRHNEMIHWYDLQADSNATDSAITLAQEFLKGSAAK